MVRGLVRIAWNDPSKISPRLIGRSGMIPGLGRQF
jgi:hypothetical protein